MLLPHIFSKQGFDIAKLPVSVCPDQWTAPPAYDVLVDAAWRQMLRESRHPLWDGTYYRLLNPADVENGMGTSPLRLGAIRYRYIATFAALHQHHAFHQLDLVHHLSTTAVIRTRDNYYLFGRRTRNGEIDLIGGGVQRDELEVTSGADLERNLLKEIREETGVSAHDVQQLTGIGILRSANSNVLIVANANLSLTKVEAIARFVLRPENEMSELVFVPETGLYPTLNSMSDYRPLIPELMQA